MVIFFHQFLSFQRTPFPWIPDSLFFECNVLFIPNVKAFPLSFANAPHPPFSALSLTSFLKQKILALPRNSAFPPPSSQAFPQAFSEPSPKSVVSMNIPHFFFLLQTSRTPPNVPTPDIYGLELFPFTG